MKHFTLLLLSVIFVVPLAFSQPVEVRIHPAQVGLFGGGWGDFLRSNPAINGAEWMPAAGLQGTLFLPNGSEGQTLFNQGGTWMPTSALKISNGGVLLNDRYGIHKTLNKTIVTSADVVQGQYFDLFLLSFNALHGIININVNISGSGYGCEYEAIIPLSYNVDYFTYFGFSSPVQTWVDAPLTNVTPRHLLADANDFSVQYYIDANTVRFRGIFKKNLYVGSRPELRITVKHSNEFLGASITEYATSGIDNGAATKVPFIFGGKNSVAYYPSKETYLGWNKDIYIRTGKVFGDDELPIESGTWFENAVNSLSIIGSKSGAVGHGLKLYAYSGTVGWRRGIILDNVASGSPSVLISPDGGNVGIGIASPVTPLHVEGTIRSTAIAGTGTRLVQASAAGDIQASSILSTDILTTGSTFGGDVSGSAANLQIIAGAVGSAEIANGSVTTTDLSATGVTSGTYGSAANIPSIIVGSDGRIISASNVASTNIYSADGTIPSGTRTVTMSDGSSIRIDASGNSTSPFSPLIIRGNASTYATRFLEFEDSDGTMRFRGLANATNVILSSTTRPVELSGSTYSRISAASAWLQVESGGFVTINGASSDPGSPANNSFWINTTALRLKTRLNSTTYQVADIERDLIGDAPNARSASFTMPAQQFYTVADANGGSFTITFDATMREGIDYVIECRRNGTNTITFDAGSGYNLAVDTVSTFPDDGAVAMGGAGGTGIQAAHKVYYVRRHGTSISVK